ncbi:MAG: C4-dicarboxylate ABC transporter, partial [Rhodobacterales bacterium CG_4_10_14_0_8_um_filter_70_9]
ANAVDALAPAALFEFLDQGGFEGVRAVDENADGLGLLRVALRNAGCQAGCTRLFAIHCGGSLLVERRPGFGLAIGFAHEPGGAFGAMFTVMLVMFVLGFFLDFLEIVFVIVPIMSPTLFMLGLDPIWVAIMMAVNLQTSFLTPPFGFALFYLRGVAPPEISTMDIYRGVIPFVIIQILALVLLALFPSLATWLPGVVFG